MVSGRVDGGSEVKVEVFCWMGRRVLRSRELMRKCRGSEGRGKVDLV